MAQPLSEEKRKMLNALMSLTGFVICVHMRPIPHASSDDDGDGDETDQHTATTPTTGGGHAEQGEGTTIGDSVGDHHRHSTSSSALPAAAPLPGEEQAGNVALGSTRAPRDGDAALAPALGRSIIFHHIEDEDDTQANIHPELRAEVFGDEDATPSHQRRGQPRSRAATGMGRLADAKAAVARLDAVHPLFPATAAAAASNTTTTTEQVSPSSEQQQLPPIRRTQGSYYIGWLSDFNDHFLSLYNAIPAVCRCLDEATGEQELAIDSNWAIAQLGTTHVGHLCACRYYTFTFKRIQAVEKVKIESLLSRAKKSSSLFRQQLLQFTSLQHQAASSPLVLAPSNSSSSSSTAAAAMNLVKAMEAQHSSIPRLDYTKEAAAGAVAWLQMMVKTFLTRRLCLFATISPGGPPSEEHLRFWQRQQHQLLHFHSSLLDQPAHPHQQQRETTVVEEEINKHNRATAATAAAVSSMQCFLLWIRREIGGTSDDREHEETLHYRMVHNANIHSGSAATATQGAAATATNNNNRASASNIDPSDDATIAKLLRFLDEKRFQRRKQVLLRATMTVGEFRAVCTSSSGGDGDVVAGDIDWSKILPNHPYNNNEPFHSTTTTTAEIPPAAGENGSASSEVGGPVSTEAPPKTTTTSSNNTNTPDFESDDLNLFIKQFDAYDNSEQLPLECPLSVFLRLQLEAFKFHEVTEPLLVTATDATPLQHLFCKTDENNNGNYYVSSSQQQQQRYLVSRCIEGILNRLTKVEARRLLFEEISWLENIDRPRKLSPLTLLNHLAHRVVILLFVLQVVFAVLTCMVGGVTLGLAVSGPVAGHMDLSFYFAEGLWYAGLAPGILGAGYGIFLSASANHVAPMSSGAKKFKRALLGLLCVSLLPMLALSSYTYGTGNASRGDGSAIPGDFYNDQALNSTPVLCNYQLLHLCSGWNQTCVERYDANTGALQLKAVQGCPLRCRYSVEFLSNPPNATCQPQFTEDVSEASGTFLVLSVLQYALLLLDVVARRIAIYTGRRLAIPLWEQQRQQQG